MKMAFELNDLKGLLFLVLLTIPSTSSTNYDCKGKSFYCLDSTHFLICVDFGGGVLTTIDDFVLPCPSLTECHESNTYECELPSIVTTTTVYPSVTENSVNSVVPLINTVTTVSPELTTVLPSTEKSTVVPVSEVVTSESNNELLESLKDKFTGGNEHLFEPTKFVTTDSIGFSVNSVVPLINTVTTVSPELTTVLPSTEKNTVVPVSEVVTSESNNELLESLKDKLTGGNEHLFEPTKFVTTDSIGFSVNSVEPLTNTVTTVSPELTTVLPSTEKSTVVPVSEVVTSESNNELLESLKDKFTGGNEHLFEPTKFITSDSIGFNASANNDNKTSRTTVKIDSPMVNEETSSENKVNNSVISAPKISVSETSDITSTTNTVTTMPPEVTTVLPSTEKNTVTTVLLEVVTQQPSTEKDTMIPALELVTFEPNQEILEKTKDEFTVSNEKNVEHTYFVPPSSVSLSPSVDKVNEISTIADKILNSKPGIETSTENTMKITVTKNSKNIDVTTSNQEILITDFKEIHFTSLNITHNNTNIKGSNATTIEYIKSKDLTGDEVLTRELPTSWLNLNTDGVISLSEMSDKSIGSATLVPLKITTVPSSTEKNIVIPTLEVVTSKSNKELLESLKHEFTGGNEKTFEPTNFKPTPLGIVDKKNYPKSDISTKETIKTVVTDSLKNIDVTPNSVLNSTNNIVINTTVSEVTKSDNMTSCEIGIKTLPTSSPNLNVDVGNVISIIETSDTSVVPIEITTVVPSTEKNTFTPALELITSKLNKEILESLTTVPPEVTTVLSSTEKNTVTTNPLEVITQQPSTEKNTVIPALELVTFEPNKEILEKIKDELTGGNEKIFKPITSVLPNNISLNPSVKKVIELNITTEKNINVKENIETSTESTEKHYVTNDPKISDFGTANEGIMITDFKNDTYTPKSFNISHTTIDTRELNITENLTSKQPPANKFVRLSSNLNSYSLHNLTTLTIENELTLDSNVITEIKRNLNNSNITDNIGGKNRAPENQKVLSNQLVQLENSTTIAPFEISSPTVTPLSSHSQMKEVNGSELFVGILDTNNASASTTKYKTINNIDIVYTTFSTTESTTNVAHNQTGENLDVISNNKNTYRTTVSNNEQTTKVTSTTHTDTTPREMHFFISSDNSLTTSITTHESTTVSSTTTENSITPLVDSVTTPDMYVNNNKEEPIDIQVKTTTTLSMENSIDVTTSPQFVVTTSTHKNLFNGKESSSENQINITTSDTIYMTTFSTTPQSKTYEIQSEHVNELIITKTGNVNTKSSNINANEDWNNMDFIKANNLSNISNLTTEKSYVPKEVNNVITNYEVSFTSALDSTFTVSSATEPSLVIKDQAKTENQNNIIDSNSVTITSTLSSSHKSNVGTEVMYTTSFKFNENIDNIPTEASSKLETVTNAEIIPEVVTLSQNIINNKTNVKNLTLTQTKTAPPDLTYTQNIAPDLKTPEYPEEKKVDIFSATMKPIVEEPLTSENILKVTKFTSVTSQGTENPLQSTTEEIKSDYQKIIAEANIPYPKEVILKSYSKPDYITSTSNTEFKTATDGAGISFDILNKNEINGSNVKDAAVVDDSTLKQVTVPVSREMLHSENTTQLPMEVVKTQSVYQSNIFVSSAVVGFTAEQKPNIVTNRTALDITALTEKPNIDNSSRISTEKTSYLIANNKTEQISAMELVSETVIIQKTKSILSGTANNNTANNSIYSTNLKTRNKYNTTIKETLQTTTQNMIFAHKISENGSNKEGMNLETTANGLEKELVNVDMGGKSKNENDNEDNESAISYGSASRIELTTPSTLDYKNNKPVINTSYVTPQSRKPQTFNINISNTITTQKDTVSKTIPAKTKVPRAAIRGNEGKVNNSVQIFDCRNKTRGKYGDSKDCQKFYTCIGTLQPIVGVCPNHTVFSEINKQCTRNLSHCVRNNQFHCLYEGRFSDYFKDNVYYICVKNSFHGFLRYKLQCQSGYYLNKAIVKCEKKVEIYEYKESVSSISENFKISNDQNKSTIKSDESEKSVINDLECKKVGIFPYSNDCRMYYECSKNKKDEYRRKIKKCSTDEVYDKEKKKCVYADSIEC